MRKSLIAGLLLWAGICLADGYPWWIVVPGSYTNGTVTVISSYGTNHNTSTLVLTGTGISAMSSNSKTTTVTISGGGGEPLWIAESNLYTTVVDFTNAVQGLTNYIDGATQGLVKADITNGILAAANSYTDQATQNLVTASVTNGILSAAYSYTDNATQNLVTASITNGLASVGYVDQATQGLVTASITNGILASANSYTDQATQGLVTASITNGLASVGYVDNATQNLVTASITNGLASIGYVDNATQNLVTASITNGLYPSSNPSNFITALSTSNFVQCILTNLIVTGMPTNSGMSGNGTYAWEWNADWTYTGWTTGRWVKGNNEFDYNSMAYRTNDTKLYLFSRAAMEFGGGREWYSTNGIYGPFVPSSGGATGTGLVSIVMLPGYVPYTTTDYLSSIGGSYSLSSGYTFAQPNGSPSWIWRFPNSLYSESNNITMSHGGGTPGPSGAWTKFSVHDIWTDNSLSGIVESDILTASRGIYGGNIIFTSGFSGLPSITTNALGWIVNTNLEAVSFRLGGETITNWPSSSAGAITSLVSAVGGTSLVFGVSGTIATNKGVISGTGMSITDDGSNLTFNSTGTGETDPVALPIAQWASNAVLSWLSVSNSVLTNIVFSTGTNDSSWAVTGRLGYLNLKTNYSSGGSGAPQSPWTTNINGGFFFLTNAILQDTWGIYTNGTTPSTVDVVGVTIPWTNSAGSSPSGGGGSVSNIFWANKLNANQSVADNTNVKITFTNEVYDYYSWYVATNSRFTALRSGKYLFRVQVTVTDYSEVGLLLFKNGSAFLGGCVSGANPANRSAFADFISCPVDLVSNDYIEAYTKSYNGAGGGASTFSGDITNTFFAGWILNQ